MQVRGQQLKPQPQQQTCVGRMAPSAVAQEGQESQGLLGHCPQVQSQVPKFKPVFFPLFLQCCLCPNLHPIQRLSGPPLGPRRSGRSCPKVLPLDVRPASLQDLPLSMTTSLASASISALSWPTAPSGRALGTAPATQQQLCPQRSLERQRWPPTQPVTSWKGPPLFPFGKITVWGTCGPRESLHYSQPPTALSEANQEKGNTAKPKSPSTLVFGSL